MKEQHRLTQVAIDSIVEESRGLFYLTLERAQAAIKSSLAKSGVDPDIIDVDDTFSNIVDPFSGIETCYLQEKYFVDHLGLIVSKPWSYCK